MRNTTTGTMWRAYGSLPGSTRSLLAVELARTAPHLAPIERVVRAKPRISLLPHHSLMHHRLIRRNAKDIVIKLNGTDGFTSLVVKRCFHFAPVMVHKLLGDSLIGESKNLLLTLFLQLYLGGVPDLN